ncbi:MAG: hypothetical protein MUO63_19650 [Desulfobulbaceae bacterium]|nr:hypothetical protein [Desulfobulbaceae bacterium]
MIEIPKTDVYAKWLDGLLDVRARTRIDYGPDYRVYYKKHGQEVVILLAGGNKRTQDGDIKTALRLARNL